MSATSLQNVTCACAPSYHHTNPISLVWFLNKPVFDTPEKKTHDKDPFRFLLFLFTHVN
jgi:hypothetical protein